ncbi:MAG: hypothetical protein J3K34DRAFT_95919 [Monoraphidium minutum]|nr:MAG: hypothetical protein J3K34DRAFT_95919 [Monoraphidium minutum]
MKLAAHSGMASGARSGGAARLGASGASRVARAPRPVVAVRSEAGGGDGGGGKGGTALSEDMIARLRAAEEEAAKLKKQLADLQQAAPVRGGRAGVRRGAGLGALPTHNKQGMHARTHKCTCECARQTGRPQPGAPAADGRGAVLDSKAQRIDGTDRRETLFSGSPKRNSWLSEEDVDFITGGGPSEASALAGPTEEQQAAIKKRVLLGGAATAALLAFALVPTKDLRLKPSKPLYFYLTALVRVQEQLVAMRELVEDGQWDTLRLLLPRIVGPPSGAKAAMYDAIALLEDRSAAARAEDVAGDFFESLANIDSPRRYYDAIPTRSVRAACWLYAD